MDIFSFTAHFGTEEDCRNHFKAQRDKIGIKCKCGYSANSSDIDHPIPI